MSAQPIRTGPHRDTIATSRRLSLVRNPGTPEQRAVRTVNADRIDQRQHAIDDAHATYPGQPLGWLSHDTNTIKEIPS